MEKITKRRNIIRRHFPASKQDWLRYLKNTLPVVVAELVFSLTSFIDNFMVAPIENGTTALSYANTWSGIVTTIFITINMIVGMLVGQFYGSKQYSKINQIMALRIWTYVSIGVIFAICAWSMPAEMIRLIGRDDEPAVNTGVSYIRLIAICWILLAVAWNTNGLLNETGHSKYAFFTACLNLSINATINAICIYGFKLGAYSAAYGTIASVFISIFLDNFWMSRKRKEIVIKVKNLFKISREITVLFFKRGFSFGIAIAGMIVIPLRMPIWNDGFIPGRVGEKWMNMNAAAVLSLTESISTVFGAVTVACGANVSVFVASNLGKNDFDEADKHAHALKGFHATAGALFSLILLIFVFIIYQTEMLSGGIAEKIQTLYKDKDFSTIQNDLQGSKFYSLYDWTNTDKDALITAMSNYAKNVNSNLICWTLLTVALVNPLWAWFYTTNALIASGGRSNLSSLTTLVAQWSQFIFLIIIRFAIVPHTNISIAWAYFIFYCWDLVRLAIYEVVQHRNDWKRNVNHEIEKITTVKQVQSEN
ncbi:MATE family efflux transporter [Mycoplasma sp. 4044]